MSSRHIRKLQQARQPDTAASQLPPDCQSNSSSCSERIGGGGGGSLFQLLDQSSVETQDEDEEQEKQQNKDVQKNDVNTRPRRRRKKKKSKKSAASAAGEDVNLLETDSIDEVIEQLAVQGKADREISTTTTTTTTTSLVAENVLLVERRHLNADNEMRRVFGRSVVSQQQHERGRRLHTAHSHTARHQHRHFSLVPDAHRFTHSANLGLSMAAPEHRGNELWFHFVHSKQYQHVERLFQTAVHSGQPDNIVALLNTYPGHVNAQLQLSEVCRLSDDAAMSAELLQRCLYTQEAVAHTLFSVTAGTARLDYNCRENRALFLAVFRHVQCLSERGCHRTALEFGKLLLSWQPSADPLALVLSLDQLALAAAQFNWLLRFFERWDSVRNLSQLPNWAYSVAAARYILATESAAVISSAAAAAANCSDREQLLIQANESLHEAIVMFPGVVPLLLGKCSSLAIPPCITSSHLFNAANERSQSNALAALCRLYVERSWRVWAEPTAAGQLLSSWLLQQATNVAQLLASQQPAMVQRDKHAQLTRQTRYVHMPLSVCRHVVCCDVKEVRALLPPEVLTRAILSHDPLPPLDGYGGYELQSTALDQHVSNGATSDGGPLASFFYSLFPGYDSTSAGGDRMAGAAAAGEGDGAVAAGDAFRSSVGSLLGAMRHLLNTMSTSHDNRPSHGDNDDGDDGDQETSDNEQEEDQWTEQNE